jgi:hypothetical protein
MQKAKFNFWNENDGSCYSFSVKGDESLPDLNDGEVMEEFWYDKLQPEQDRRQLEEIYGIHDISGDDTCFWGFTSYEIEDDKFPELMEIWKDIFKSFGYEVG